MSRRSGEYERGGIQIAEDAISLLRQTSFAVWALYFLGTVPFSVGLITFWYHMSHSPFAAKDAAPGALALTGAFLWMKLLQARFAQHLLAQLRGEAAPQWTAGCIWRSLCCQAWYQSLGLFVLPCSMALFVPFGWVYGFLQHVTALDDGRGNSGGIGAEAFRLCNLWPRQNHTVIWLLSPFLLLGAGTLIMVLFPAMNAFFPLFSNTVLFLYALSFFLAFVPFAPAAIIIFINVVSGIATAAFLLRTFLAWETMINRTPGFFQMQIVIAVSIAVAWLVMDPAVKAAYVIRSFYGHSRATGEDLRVLLRRTGAAAAMVVVGMSVFTLPAHAQVAPEDLNDAIERQLEDSRYDWRYPREALEVSDDNFIISALQSLARMLERIKEWAENVLRRISDWLFPDGAEGGGAGTPWSAWRPVVRLALLALVGVLIVLLLILLYRYLKYRLKTAAPIAEAIAAAPDLRDEQTTADQLPEDGWLRLAQEMLDKGEYRLAMRALFLAQLARLSHHELIRVARYKTNYDYRQELRRRAHAHPQIPPLFEMSVHTFENVWYGNEVADTGLVNRMREQQEAMRLHA